MQQDSKPILCQRAIKPCRPQPTRPESLDLIISPSTMADQLAAEHRNGVKFHQLQGIRGLSDAYRVQDAYVASIIADDTQAGYKIGLTSKRMQDMCGIDQPISGTIFGRKVARSGIRLSLADYNHLGLEFEICCRLGRDLVPADSPVTPEQAGDAIDAVAAAIELVDDRHADYSVLDINTLVADNSWNAGVVLGDFVPPPARLDETEGIAYQDGEEIGRGHGADALGHPFIPLAWLANHLAASGRTLRKGDIVMTGSIVTTRFPSGPFTFRFDIGGLGSVEVYGE
ncbi:fumarylacetoacetate hydrolase family protein [Microvirga terrae]|uniref:Fumarylacetoacetate hydrolase family protein n=1 Tax=Microvirga terrae TaxID=2740529 RepID=A0ABY5RXC7_9HYPH|nr:fumarylacetoacetate hydrolase family protein [Microvirga terrae]UVF21638.1 fumarylacetoacetate hydrolase family protein [Microvirga terrae]